MKKDEYAWLIPTVVGGVVGASLGLGAYFVERSLRRPRQVPIKNNDPAIREKLLGEDENCSVSCMLQERKTKLWLGQVKSEDVAITSGDGLFLAGKLFHPETESHKWVVLLHGYSSRKERMFNYARQYVAMGYHALCIDQRAHGQSEGLYSAMGWKEKDDVLCWLSRVIAPLDSEAQIVIHGVSMGGATVMMLSGCELPENVKVLVEDCGYTSVWDIFARQLKVQYGYDPFPILHSASFVNMLRFGFGYRNASSLMGLENAGVPILFIHGQEDAFVPVEMAREAYDVAPVPKKLVVVEHATHANAVYADWERYWAEVRDFVGRYIE